MRKSGVLMHISSLPGNYGIGSLGEHARKFVDFLRDSAQSYWQILPICPTGFGDSPYQSFSTFAGNPYFIDLDTLIHEGLIQPHDVEGITWCSREDEVDYGALYSHRYGVLRKACLSLIERDNELIDAFRSDNADWIEDYALFMALKDAHCGTAWHDWPQALVRRQPEAIEKAKSELADDIEFYVAMQYLFHEQWKALKLYANNNGVNIIGDLPIYVAIDSADIWSNPGQFLIGDDLQPLEVAGVPPDGFSDTGQLWGNPLFDWERMQRDNFDWWMRRIAHVNAIYDVTRIDHFRGFDSFYAIPFGDQTAQRGEWRKGPGTAFFEEISRRFGEVAIIAEDLGYLTPDVLELVRKSGFPGMEVLQFAFDPYGDSLYLPHNHKKNKVIYSGTHDNDTIIGWMSSAPQGEIQFAKQYLHMSESEGYNWGMMRAVWSSVSDLAIVCMQDLLGLDGSARMNTPATSCNNWKWRMTPDAISSELTSKVRELTHIFRRI